MAEPGEPLLSSSLLRLEYRKVLRDIAERASSDQGRVEVMALGPAWNRENSLRMQSETEYASILFQQEIRPPSDNLDALSEINDLLKTGVFILTPLQLRNVGVVLQDMERFICSVEKTMTDNDDAGSLDDYTRDLPRLSNLSSKLIGMTTPEGELSPDASKELSRLLGRVDRLKRNLSRKIERISASYSGRNIIRDAPHTVREGRYVLPVVSSRKKMVKGIVHDRSETGETVFIEPVELVEDGNALREASLDLDCEKRRIIREASLVVREHADELGSGCRAAVILDAVFARASYHLDMATVFPSRGSMNLVNLGHPLIPENELVKNNVDLPEDWRVLIISGPNAGGKSVLLKALGLAVVCSQSGIGSFVSSGSTIPFFERIYVSIGDQQSIAHHLSTYSARLQEQLEMLENLGSGGLALIDEPAAGTDPLTGTALAASLLEHLASAGCRLVVTTHHGQLKNLAQGRPGFVNGCMNFHMETLEPAYTFTCGIPGSSFTLEIARKMNFPEQVLQRAEHLSGDSFKLDRMLEEITTLRSQADVRMLEIKKREEEYVMERNRSRRELEAGWKELKDTRRRLEEESRKQRENISSAADALLSRLAKAETSQDRRSLRADIRQVIETRDKPADEKASPDEAPAGILPGTWVTLEGWSGVGLVEVLAKNHAVVLMGNLRLRKPLTELSPAAPPGKVDVSSDWSVPTEARVELDLRGLSSDEAVLALDSALDDSIVAGMPQLRVIHGKGKGVLMRAIVDIAKSDSRIASFRQGRPFEGGTGVTIMLLNYSGNNQV